MYDIKAEMIDGKVYFAAEDLQRICQGSISGEGTPFDFALKSLASQLKNMENEAINNLSGENK